MIAALVIEPTAAEDVLGGPCCVEGDKVPTTFAPTESFLVLLTLLELATVCKVTGIGFEKTEQGDATRIGVGFKICFAFNPSDPEILGGTGGVTDKGASDLEAFEAPLDPLLASIKIA